MNKIIPHLWFDSEAKEAMTFYTTLFKNSRVTNITRITGTPSGDCDIVTVKLAGQDFMAISAGPYFQFNPSISLFTVFNTEVEIDGVWEKLSEGGKILMEYGSYPWARKYGWLQDKYGLSWQLSLSGHHKFVQKITPLLMFTQEKAGLTKKAIEEYVSIFPNSKIDLISLYEKGEDDVEGYIKHSQFTLSGQHFMAMGSSQKHEFTFNEAISFIVNCDTQEEIDYYWAKLSAVPESEQCGWLKDKYGVSWQIVPTAMGKFMGSGDAKKTERVTQAFLKMKKFDIAKLKKAYDGK